MSADCVAAIRTAQVLVFDFDGTLVDSNDIKWRGFELAFADFPDQIAEIMTYCRGLNHTVRSEKFRHVYEHILRRPYTAEAASILHERYASATTAAVVTAPEIPGASSFLRRIAGRYTTVLLSSTPHEIILDILRRREMGAYFDHVQGAPIDKSAWLSRFRVAQPLTPGQIVFFGDTPEDLVSARVSQCTFVGVGKDLMPSNGHYAIRDYHDLHL